MDPNQPPLLDGNELSKIRSLTRASLACGAGVLVSIATAIAVEDGTPLLATFPAWLAQIILGLAAARRAKRALRQIDLLGLPVDMAVRDELQSSRRAALIIAILGLLGGVLVLALGALAVMALGAIAGAWGRPLRAGQKSVGATIGPCGHRWAEGPRPQLTGLDEPTRQALGRMWLHDAQKEHGSVPAFAQLTWQLAQLGAPPELLARSNRAALEEIEHTRRCFALTEAYLGRTFGVGPIDEVPAQLLFATRGWLRSRRSARLRLAIDVACSTLEDGCLIEDLNADFAERAHALALDPAAEALTATIAAEERDHAALAWDILRFCVALDPQVHAAVARKLDALPTRVLIPYSIETTTIIREADAQALMDHGRVPFARWPAIYRERRAATVARAEALLAETATATASAPAVAA